MRPAALLALTLMAPAALGASLDLPAGATRAAQVVEPLGSYLVPTGPWTALGIEAVTVEGGISREAWHLPSSATTLQILAPLRAQLAAQGYEVIFECQARQCGGFDFRFETEVLPEPQMHVDLADYRFLAARRAEGGATEFVTLLVSRSSATGYLQLIRVGAAGAIEANAEPLTQAPPPVIPEAPPVAGDLAAQLESTGRAVLGDLAFETGSSRLAEGDFASLAALADYLRANPKRRITLVGHTDASGALPANIALSRARAASVKERLVAGFSVPAGQIASDGVGYLMPLASNLTAEGRTLNRRVEAVLSSTE